MPIASFRDVEVKIIKRFMICDHSFPDPHFDILFCLNVSLGSVSGYDLHWRATREDKWPNLALGLPAREFHREIQKKD